jgi:hypothetical protein
MRDLDQLLINAWNVAFDGVATTDEYLDLTQSYVALAKRDAVHDHATKVYYIRGRVMPTKVRKGNS